MRLFRTTLITTAVLTALAASGGVNTTPKAPGNSVVSISYIVQAQSSEVAERAVRAVGGRVTHELKIVDAVGATLTPAQFGALHSNARLQLSVDRKATLAGYAGTPYVVRYTQAAALHSGAGAWLPRDRVGEDLSAALRDVLGRMQAHVTPNPV